VAGFLAFSEKSAFPSLQTVAFVGFPIMEITVAGTAQVLHLIPFYALMEHQDITIRGAKVQHFFQSASRIPFFLLPYPFDHRIL
jgi:hypothetical protein